MDRAGVAHDRRSASFAAGKALQAAATPAFPARMPALISTNLDDQPRGQP